MDATQWTAVLEALDEVESRIPEGDPLALHVWARVSPLRVAAEAARDFARSEAEEVA